MEIQTSSILMKQLILIHPEPEIWKIVSIAPKYEVSSHGRVRNKWSKFILKPGKWTGYLGVAIVPNKKAKSGVSSMGIHRLVAMEFIGPRPEGKCINHIDGNRTNNHVSNLEYVTPKENMRHAIENGFLKPIPAPKGEQHPLAKISEKEVLKIREIYKKGGISYLKLSNLFNVCPTEIFNIVHYIRWKHLIAIPSEAIHKSDPNQLSAEASLRGNGRKPMRKDQSVDALS